MVHDDGLSPKEVLKLQKVGPIGFLGKDVLAIQEQKTPVINNSKAYLAELAGEFRRAIEALPEMPDKTCDRCGIELQTIDDHKTVDRQFMRLECVKQYSLEEINGYER
jgi:hypothetical protein